MGNWEKMDPKARLWFWLPFDNGLTINILSHMDQEEQSYERLTDLRMYVITHYIRLIPLIGNLLYIGYFDLKWNIYEHRFKLKKKRISIQCYLKLNLNQRGVVLKHYESTYL